MSAKYATPALPDNPSGEILKITKINKLDKKGELVYVPSQTFLSNRIGVKVTSQLQKVEEPVYFWS